jgi:tRNA-dihydrouridine synthase B
MKIANTNLPHGLILAPMAGVTDRTMRRISADFGCEYAVSEMVSAKAIVYEQESRASVPVKTALLCNIEEGTIPTAVQIFGSEPEFMAEAARLISDSSYRGFEGTRPDAIDINMGCPVKKVVQSGDGSALMKNPELIHRITESVVKASSLPVTVKIRAGWSKDSKNAVECALAAESAGASAICVHGRTRDQFYSPGVDLSIIGEVKSAVRVPVIGNGDLFSVKQAMQMKEETGCDGFALARGAMGNPWLFSQIADALDGKEFAYPSHEEVQAIAEKHLDMAIAHKGERRGLAEAKIVVSHYFRGIRGATRARFDFMNSMTYAEAHDALVRAFESAEEDEA